MKTMKKSYPEFPLTHEDKKKLKLQLIPILIFSVFAGGIFFFIHTMVLKNMEDGYVSYIFLAFGLLFMAIIIFSFWSILADIRTGIKYRIEGTVTDKRIDVRTTTKSRGAGKASTTSTKRYYYVTIDEEEFGLSNTEYGQLQVSDVVLFEISPRAKKTLLLEVVQRKEAPAAIFDTVEQHNIQSKKALQNTGAIKLTEEDRQILKRRFKRDVGRRLLFMSVPLFISISLIASDLGSLLIFLFPIVIIVVIQIYKLLKVIAQSTGSRDKDTKDGRVAKVVDKSTISGNERKTKYLIKTDVRLLTVPEEAYRELENGDQLIALHSVNKRTPFRL